MLSVYLNKSNRFANKLPLLSKRFSYRDANPPTATTKSSKIRSLEKLGLQDLAFCKDSICYHNLSYGEIADQQGKREEGIYCSNGAFVVDTGKFTGRSPMDKYIVKQEPSSKSIWWGDINRPMDPELFDTLYQRAIRYYHDKVKDIYVFDGYCGAHKKSSKKVRFVTEQAWHHHFVTNMFIRPKHDDKDIFNDNFESDFTIINCYGMVDDEWKKHNLNSEVFVTFNIEKKIAIVGGTWYGGEMKKGIFSMMHYWMPRQHCLSMHCSANIGSVNNDTCLFFGLSGTGKTTLSTDAHRKLIGDDEHGWDEDGIFNFEGGCYAKTSKLSIETEPEIYNAIRANALLENVWIDPITREPDYFNLSMTENGRVAYPIEHIDNREDSLCGGHPKYIIFLCADAFGVLPPISKLNSEQAMYHFISGYTAKVAGTERGIKEPKATFSPCYGAAFLTLHPMEYAKLFKEKLEQHDVDCYLVNTGWSGGSYGVGQRMSIKTTRSCINSIFDGSIKKTKFRKDKVFGFQVPESLPNVDDKILEPRNTWQDKEAYDREYKKLGSLFVENFAKYAHGENEQYKKFGPKV